MVEVTIKFNADEAFEAKAAMAGQDIIFKLDDYREFLRSKARYGEDDKDDEVYKEFMERFGEVLMLME